MAIREMVFVDIDTQFDFMDPKGTLFVPGAPEITNNLAKLVSYAKEKSIPIVASVDAHPVDDPEFSQFPPHCVRNTPGQEKVSATFIETATIIAASKQELFLSEKASNYILEKTIFSIFGNENAENIFKVLDAKNYYVFGVATDYCVKAAVLGLLERGYKVTVVEDAISGVTPETSLAALDEMKLAGAKFARTSEIIAS
ncbi:MAG: cysteine hydrolase [Acidobacteria bacterium]|nr:cysteine hydrolase [Acidobacteriota bacterium]